MDKSRDVQNCDDCTAWRTLTDELWESCRVWAYAYSLDCNTTIHVCGESSTPGTCFCWYWGRIIFASRSTFTAAAGTLTYLRLRLLRTKRKSYSEHEVIIGLISERCSANGSLLSFFFFTSYFRLWSQNVTDSACALWTSWIRLTSAHYASSDLNLHWGRWSKKHLLQKTSQSRQSRMWRWTVHRMDGDSMLALSRSISCHYELKDFLDYKRWT